MKYILLLLLLASCGPTPAPTPVVEPTPIGIDVTVEVTEDTPDEKWECVIKYNKHGKKVGQSCNKKELK